MTYKFEQDSDPFNICISQSKWFTAGNLQLDVWSAGNERPELVQSSPYNHVN